ncbi:bifunctional D-glycero-beta-D-manno-heptose-7-phosphate kinase/D-glycero-beta-D-manno-heptose 1-phosphate adenylyltransferase HldE [Shewanella sp. 1_MG-2023]|uniref:bifunctional D-glycero-beta-D-manno-heptose-7-phosphate kinase/D-glycero-beta-D-manno-heptose 1-phosphate adenylyltransferase HldE n=1 Tax=unclassified Shewanella TaxID=196818 RepID=UPI000C823B43|nr:MULTISPECIES: bifunctional D-glycero-beta-D-manno-heptose-7-phosphate kinase/D-glycero-beta-D-manno-heptose 1-phosphate adenylyltransferase HldE [unclassified Shewanella]MDO6611479.1 bifunctional D-glycero-beta-D-manno-heptose-7-phosphate kinase/D-glycero-beta-D-manno-heptose 1-phosphate adenylyltransferase HldE [Shewanella sp. 7_MG-2023]MDO6771334.1 bifunctional D-glycero-beta-D-manno-heptose-7-phosphate kinase/D-glycero-beta-D-manno-heptose 1-phosphate adenylyltransferase HldE [Shewanella sp
MKVSLPAFEKARVLVVGDVMLDRYWVGPTGRISPEAPVPVVNINEIEDRPGGAANVALNIAALGGQIQLAGIVGADETAQALTVGVQAQGVEPRWLTVADKPTITKLRVFSRNQQLIRLDFEEKYAKADSENLFSSSEAILDDVDVLVLSDYAKGAIDTPVEFIAKARAKGVTVLVDPKGTDFARYRGASLLTPNMSEFEAVVGAVTDEADLIAKAKQLIKEHNFDAMLVTRSEKGMTLISQDEAELHIPTVAREVYDVTGAGDTVISALATSLAAGSTMAQACSIANIAAGVVVAKLGTATVSRIELIEALALNQGESGFGVVTEDQLAYALEQARLRGEKVVMTNGCFDILHAGHVSYLQQAKALGDRLIVAVNDDASVKRLKGEGRPVNQEDRRMAVLAGLASVDWVIPFSEDTPQRVISRLLPDSLVKGGDYKVEEVAGGTEVMAAGGKVEILGFEDGVSTTAIIENIMAKK